MVRVPSSACEWPESGPGALASTGRRVAALLIDWLIAYGLALLALRLGVMSTTMLATAVWVVWFVLGVMSVRLFGFTPGQCVMGLRVVVVDGGLPIGSVGLGRAVGRGLLIGLVIPPLFTDSAGRGGQDRLTATAVVRR
ncbi:MAG: RDD family protein [Mycobacteriaceae bacterium]|nr:RDD family protein [Mycobacteriaceae bacterium]